MSFYGEYETTVVTTCMKELYETREQIEQAREQQEQYRAAQRQAGDTGRAADWFSGAIKVP